MLNEQLVYLHGKQMLRYKRCDMTGNALNCHYYIQCLEKKHGCLCSFDDRATKKHDGAHECQFYMSQLTLQQVLKLNKTDESQVHIDADIVALHAKFLVNANMSFKMATSDIFYEFLDAVIKRSLKAPEHLSPQSIYPHVNRKQMRRKIAEQASAKFSSLLLSLKGKLVCVSVDAGTLFNTHYVIACISNPFASIKSHLIKLVTSDGSMTQDDYAMLAANIITFLHKHGIRSCSFVSDGLISQVNAFSDTYRLHLGENDPLIIYSPCVCHLVELALKKSMNEVQYLIEMKQLIHYIVNIIRTNRNIKKVGKKCPRCVETRWSYLSRVVHFIGNNLGSIAPVVSNEYHELLGQIKFVAVLLEPYKALVSILESEHTSIQDVFPLFLEAIDYYDHLHTYSPVFESNNVREAIITLRNKLLAYITESRFSALFLLAYILTPCGLHAARRKNVYCAITPDNDFYKTKPALASVIRPPDVIMQDLHFSLESIDEFETTDPPTEEEDDNESTGTESDYSSAFIDMTSNMESETHSEDDLDEPISDQQALEIEAGLCGSEGIDDWFVHSKMFLLSLAETIHPHTQGSHSVRARFISQIQF